MIQAIPVKEQQAIRTRITRSRVDTLIPPLMAELGIDFWVVPSGDFNLDPVQTFLLEEDSPSSNVLVFSNCGGTFEKFINARFLPYGEGDFYKNFVAKGEDTYEALARLIGEKKPRNIAVNTSQEFSILDGISHTDYERVRQAAGDVPLISAEELAMRFMQHRTEAELENYELSAAAARALIRETVSRAVITPGVTTTDDVRWFMRQRIREMGMNYTWGPNCDLQRQGCAHPMLGGENEVEVIQPGDLLHIDFGVSYLQTETDMQYLCYVLRDGELCPPEGLVKGFETCRKYQQIYMDTVRPGMTGNALWREINAKAEAAGLKAMVYSHPIGFHVHGVGANMGRFGRTPDISCGNYLVRDGMCFAMEQNVRVTVPEWDDQEIFIFREEDVALVNGRIRVIGELQPQLFVI